MITGNYQSIQASLVNKLSKIFLNGRAFLNKLLKFSLEMFKFFQIMFTNMFARRVKTENSYF